MVLNRHLSTPVAEHPFLSAIEEIGAQGKLVVDAGKTPLLENPSCMCNRRALQHHVMPKKFCGCSRIGTTSPGNTDSVSPALSPSSSQLLSAGLPKSRHPSNKSCAPYRSPRARSYSTKVYLKTSTSFLVCSKQI